jgi:hypothetical protein
MYCYYPVYLLVFLPSLSLGLELAKYHGNGLTHRDIIYICGPNPTDCGGGWCCSSYDTCVDMHDETFGCVAPGATNSDG